MFKIVPEIFGEFWGVAKQNSIAVGDLLGVDLYRKLVQRL